MSDSYMHPTQWNFYPKTERDRMPYIQIDTDTWIVMRDSREHPVAIIEHVPSTAGISKYLVRKWHESPSRRPLVSMHDSLEEANRSVPWATDRVQQSQQAVPDVRDAAYGGREFTARTPSSAVS